MEWLKAEIDIETKGQGLLDFTGLVEERVKKWQVREGMCYLYLQHTSASLCISENYDPSARRDLERFLTRLAPENEAWQEHTIEGSDDSPSHMKAMVTGISQIIPIDDGKLSLGTWQGIYLCEHRKVPHRRRVLLRCLKAG